MAVSYKDREALADAVEQFIKAWLQEHDIKLGGDEIGKLLDLVGMRFINAFHAARTARGKNKHGEYM